ncbi:MAG: hypothetical protein ACI312_02685 [Bacilli bacterium]
MKNKPKIKDIVIYFHPVIGNVTLFDIINILKDLSKQVRKYENLSLELLKKFNVSDDTYNSLFYLLSSSIIDEILEDLETNIE